MDVGHSRQLRRREMKVAENLELAGEGGLKDFVFRITVRVAVYKIYS
jgi:hypothetical protein